MYKHGVPLVCGLELSTEYAAEVDPRLKRLPVDIYEGEETLIWYEPIRDQCEREFNDSGIGAGPGGYIFVLRTESGELRETRGLLAQRRTIGNMDRFPRAAVDDSKSDRLLGGEN